MVVRGAKDGKKEERKKLAIFFKRMNHIVLDWKTKEKQGKVKLQNKSEKKREEEGWDESKS